MRSICFYCSLGLLLTSVGCAGLSPLDYPATGPVQGAVHGPAVVVPPPEPMTLPRYLGLDVVVAKTALLARCTREKAAAFVPALEPHPAALPLSHPANAHSASPAVANVHKLKKAKAENAVKVKAVAALASFDCASNPHVEEGLLASLDDAAPEVRIAAIEAVLQSTRSCGQGCGGCCSAAIRAKLTQMVFEKTGPCCWSEPDPKARRLARLALDACGGPVDTDVACACESNGVPLETPSANILEQMR